MFLDPQAFGERFQVKSSQRPLLSNRCSFCIRNNFPEPTIPSSSSIGVDMLAVEIPLALGIGDPKMFLSNIKNTIVGRWATKATTRHFSTGALLKWQFLKSRWSIRLEFNPSRFIDPDGCSLASPSQAIHIIAELIKEFMLYSDDALPCFVINSAGEIDIENWQSNWTDLVRICRLDTAADFVIDSAFFDLENYKEISPKYSKATNLTFNRKALAETWTGIYSNKDGFPSFYDKSSQAFKKKFKNPPLEGTRRFEFRLERKTLDRVHIHVLSDLTQSKFEIALREGWEYSRLGQVVYHQTAWTGFITNSNLEPDYKLKLIGFLYADLNEINLGLTREEKEEFKSCARSLGLTFRQRLDKQWYEAMYLDLDSQQLIAINSSRLVGQNSVHE